MAHRPISADDIDPDNVRYLVAAILHQACLDAMEPLPTSPPVRRKSKKGRARTDRDILKIEHARKRELLATVRLREEAREYIYCPDSKHLAEQIGWNLWPPSEDDLAAFAQSRKYNSHKF